MYICTKVKMKKKILFLTNWPLCREGEGGSNCLQDRTTCLKCLTKGEEEKNSFCELVKIFRQYVDFETLYNNAHLTMIGVKSDDFFFKFSV